MTEKSRYAHFGELLGLDGRRPPDTEEARREIAALGSIELPPLVLTARKPRVVPYVLMALAAAVALLVFTRFDAGDDLTVKGDATIKLFWTRNGAAQLIAPDTRLASGDRIMAEVAAATPSHAYWLVATSGGPTQAELDAALAARLTLAAGERRSFASSFELVGPNESESLLVVVCPKDRAPTLASLRSFAAKAAPRAGFDGCNGWRQQLR